MKRVKYWMLGIILLLVYSCSDRFEDDNRSLKDVGITEIRSYFEKNATDLAPLTFPVPGSLTRSSNSLRPELIPEWDQAIEFDEDDWYITEAPIRSQSGVICTERITKDAVFLKEVKIRCQRRLVIARKQDGETDMFIATLVPDEGSVTDMDKPFTGRVFYSDLNGKFRIAMGYKDGLKSGPLLIGAAHGFAIYTQEGAPLDYSKISFEESSALRSATYSSRENGGGDFGWGGGGAGGGGGGGGSGTGGGGSGSGSGSGSGGGGGGYDPDYDQGLAVYEKIRTDLEYGNVQIPCLRPRNAGYDIINGFSIGVNTKGFIYSCLSYMNDPIVKRHAGIFGKSCGVIGVGLNIIQTVIAFSDSNFPNPKLWEIALSVLNLAGVVCAFIPILVPVAGVLGVATCVIGVVTSVIYYARTQLIQIPLDDGSNIYVYISPCMTSIA